MRPMKFVIAMMIAGALVCPVVPLYGAPQQPASSPSAAHNWTTEQIVTSSVREAWALGGKTPEGFFEIVKALTEISARKRGLEIPENERSGVRTGDWIKKQAKKDPDQLLYVIVDQAVQHNANR